MSQHRTILVVDDNAEIREGLTAMLGQQGYRTLQADDGWEAKQLIDQHRPDLVLLDMMMPRWGGLAVLEQFRGQSGAPRFIMMTATTGERHKSYAEELGVVDYLHKPFSMEVLLERVNKVMPVPCATETAPQAEAIAESIRCRCPGCGSRIKAPKQLVGQTRTCPRCRLAFVVLLPQEDEGPKLVMDDGYTAPPVRTSRSWGSPRVDDLE